jgi:hypothetical protein
MGIHLDIITHVCIVQYLLWHYYCCDKCCAVESALYHTPRPPILIVVVARGVYWEIRKNEKMMREK